MTRSAGCIAATMWALAGAVPGQHIEVSFELPPHGVSFGEPFAVTVQRSWAGGEPAPFDDKALAPLSVQLEEAVPLPASGDSGTHAGERRRYRARAFMVGEVRIPAIEFRHRGEVATCTPAPFVVKSVLPEPPGEMEWPGDLRQWPRRGSWHWWVAALVAALLGGVWWWRRPAPAAAEPERVRQPPAHELTFAELAALALPDQHDVAVDAFYAALAEIVRGHTQRRFSLPAQVRTSQEIVAAVPIGTTPLQRCLLACDVVKFGALRPAREAHALARQQAEAFVMATVVAAPASQVQAP